MLPALDYTLIDTIEKLEDFYQKNIQTAWMAIDTEFIGERRYETLLCLIQVTTEHGFYLIDPLSLPDFSLFLKMVEDPSIMKITHAGENDYRLLHHSYGTIPKNVFDTQIAAGFIGLGYPTSYGKLVEKELNVILDKGYAATDWEARPLKRKQLEYALSDVYHLYDLYRSLHRRLSRRNRLAWVKSENDRWETPQYYERDPHREALMNTLMHSVKQHKQIFLIRLYEWRRSEAQRLNYSKEMVFPAKFIATILRGIDSGKQGLLDSRIIPNHIVELHWQNFQNLYKKEVTAEELEILARLPKLSKEDPRKEVSMELLHVLVKAKCMESGIAPQLVLNKSDLTYAQPGEDVFGSDDDIEDWRKAFLGDTVMKWLNERGELQVDFDNAQVVITLKE
jgi:ribonuclease D